MVFMCKSALFKCVNWFVGTPLDDKCACDTARNMRGSQIEGESDVRYQGEGGHSMSSSRKRIGGAESLAASTSTSAPKLPMLPASELPTDPREIDDPS